MDQSFLLMISNLLHRPNHLPHLPPYLHHHPFLRFHFLLPHLPPHFLLLRLRPLQHRFSAKPMAYSSLLVSSLVVKSARIAADVFLWRNKKVSAGVLEGATAIWVLFELVEYHLLALICHILIAVIAVLFLLSNAQTIIYKSPPSMPEVNLPEVLRLEKGGSFGRIFHSAPFPPPPSGLQIRAFSGIHSGFTLWVAL